MLPVHHRMAEIFQEHLKGTLSDDLGLELQHCLKVNAEYCLDMNFLNNQLIQARTTKDVKWEAHITAQMDWLRRSGRVVKR